MGVVLRLKGYFTRRKISSPFTASNLQSPSWQFVGAKAIKTTFAGAVLTMLPWRSGAEYTLPRLSSPCGPLIAVEHPPHPPLHLTLTDPTASVLVAWGADTWVCYLGFFPLSTVIRASGPSCRVFFSNALSGTRICVIICSLVPTAYKVSVAQAHVLQRKIHFPRHPSALSANSRP